MERLSLSRQQWRVQVDQWQKSGQSMTSFCKSKEISKSSLSYWDGKFRKEKDEASSSFVELSVNPPKLPEPRHCEIFFPDGTRMLFYQEPDYRDLKQLFS
jgi:hypothetical protein